MKVRYIGKYVESSVCFRGKNFTEGVGTEVDDAWYDVNGYSKNIKVEKPKRKAKKVVADDNSD